MAKSTDNSLIGIDVCLQKVKAAQLERAADHWRVKATGAFDLPEPAETLDDGYVQFFTENLRRVIDSEPFTGSDAVATLPPDLVDVRTLTLPGSDEDIEKVLRWEAESYLSYDVNEAAIDYVELGYTTTNDERRAEVLVATCRRAKIERFVKMLRASGLRLKAVEIIPTALARLACECGEEDDTPSVAVVDTGNATTTAVITGGGELRLTRQILQGGARITRLIADGLDMSLEDAEALKKQHGFQKNDPVTAMGTGGASPNDPVAEDMSGGTVVVSQDKIASVVSDLTKPALEQLAEEVQKLLRYSAVRSQGAAVQRVIVTGGGALLKGLGDFLEHYLGAEVEVVHNINNFFGSDSETDAPPSFAVAAGLALRER